MTKICSALLCFVSLNAWATTYYVKPGGNNNNSGTSEASAFSTLQHASGIVATGDSVVVKAGNYTGFYHTTSGNASNPIVFAAQSGVVINASNGITQDGINIEGADYITIEGFTIINIPRAGIRSVINTGVRLKNNTINNCGVWGILTGFSENILIEGNECSHSAQQHGIYFSNSADNPIIKNNICHDNAGCGIHMNGDVSLGGDGIISGALVEKNIIYNNGNSGGSGINCDGVQNSRIQNNLLYNNHASGISLYQIDAGDAAKNNVVVNNTVLQPSDGRWALNISDGSTGNIVFNNIFYSAHSFRGSISIDAASSTGFESDHNVMSNRMSSDGGNTNQTLAQWTSNMQADANSILSTPIQLFVDASANNYHLSPTSSAAEVGLVSFHSKNAPLFDLENTSRPQGNLHDAGAFEKIAVTGLTAFIATPPAVTWQQVSNEEQIFLLDRSGRVIFKGTKREVSEKLQTLTHGLYLFKTKNTNKNIYGSGWVAVN